MEGSFKTSSFWTGIFMNVHRLSSEIWQVSTFKSHISRDQSDRICWFNTHIMGRKDISGEGENAKTWILICLNHSIELKTCNSSLIMQQPELLQWQEPVLWKCINHQHMKVKTHCWLLWFKPHKLCGESWNPHLPLWTHSYMYCMNCATKGITNKVPLYKL